ncbi:MAG: HAD-IB family hydrolase [Acidobacteria bacterium]|nr:HAD-IB family hydrolase [Acidobacteriota bacterium]
MNVAAFFDIDGTLVPSPSLEKRFLSYLRWRGAVGAANYARWLRALLSTMNLPAADAAGGWEIFIARNKAYLEKVPVAAMDAWLAWLARHPIERIPEALRRMDWHARQGHRIFLLSGTLRPLADAVARLLPVPVEVCATEMESMGGRYTGRVRGEAVCGPGKARAMERLATEFSLDLARSYAYGDSYADRWMLERVGHPAAVQIAASPAWRLAWLARRRGWPVLQWSVASREGGKIKRGDAEGAEGRREAAAIIGADGRSR